MMNEVHALSKGIKTNIISYDKVTDPSNVSKILDVVSKLVSMPNSRTASINELKLDSNSLRWVTSLLKKQSTKIHKNEFEYLLSSLTDRFKTRMREDSKYAIGLLSQQGLLLSHSIYGEETITPNWKIIPRMLDTGNVLRYVYFSYVKGIIQVKFWEKTSTLSFMEWLGLSRKQGFLYGGACSINTQLDGMTSRLELTEEEVDKLIQDHPEFKEGKINLSSSVRLVTINDVRYGNKTFEKVSDFLQIYEAEKHGIPIYQKKYEQFKENTSPLWFQYFDTKTALVRYEGGETIVEISKDLPDMDLLFVNDSIKLDDNYAQDLIARIINNEVMNIYHAALPFQSPPEVIGKLKLYNRVSLSSLGYPIISYYNTTDFQDSSLALCVKYLIFAILAEVNKDLPISHFFKNIANGLTASLKVDGRLTELEGSIIEYKSRDVFVGVDDKIAETLAVDLIEKLKKANFKIYIIGVEDDGMIDPIPHSRLRNDRIEHIRSKLQAQLPYTKIQALLVIQDRKGLVIMIVRKLDA